jgi:pyrimidine-nucleoside phosphorylase
MQKYEDALKLAHTMVGIGEEAGRKMVALITAMEQPLGYAIGNALEVREAIDTLSGNGPADLVELVTELGSEMLLISGIVSTTEEAKSVITTNLHNRKGLGKFANLINAQGGDGTVVENPNLLPQAAVKVDIVSECSGFVEAIDTLEVGLVARALGSERRAGDDAIDPSTGVYLKKKIGDKVKAGESLAVLHSDGNKEKLKLAGQKLSQAYTIGPKRGLPSKLILARVTRDGVEEF